MSAPQVKIEKKIIGWREFIKLPNLGIKKIKVKVDTGAATSALHAEDIVIFEKHGKKLVRFTIYPLQNNKRKKLIAEAALVETRKIRSSTGHLTERPVIRTLLKIGTEEAYEIDVTLVNRDIMGFRMLLGRRALKKRFLVNPNKSFLLSENPVKKNLSHKKHG